MKWMSRVGEYGALTLRLRRGRWSHSIFHAGAKLAHFFRWLLQLLLGDLFTFLLNASVGQMRSIRNKSKAVTSLMVTCIKYTHLLDGIPVGLP